MANKWKESAKEKEQSAKEQKTAPVVGGKAGKEEGVQDSKSGPTINPSDFEALQKEVKAQADEIDKLKKRIEEAAKGASGSATNTT